MRTEVHLNPTFWTQANALHHPLEAAAARVSLRIACGDDESYRRRNCAARRVHACRCIEVIFFGSGISSNPPCCVARVPSGGGEGGGAQAAESLSLRTVPQCIVWHRIIIVFFVPQICRVSVQNLISGGVCVERLGEHAATHAAPAHPSPLKVPYVDSPCCSGGES